MRLMTAMIAVAAAAPLLAGCQWHRPAAPAADSYETLSKNPDRDTEAAKRHYARGVQLLKEDQLDQAEKAFQAALSADLFFGPAHNNLGTVYLRQQKHYLAAWEFQYAAKLMPNQAEPRNNLGLVYEAVGKLDDAAKSYEQALDLEPESSLIAGNLARAYVRTNRNDDKTRKLLEAVVMRDTRPDWVSWARERLALMGKARPPTTAPTSMPTSIELSPTAPPVPASAPTAAPTSIEPPTPAPTAASPSIEPPAPAPTPASTELPVAAPIDTPTTAPAPAPAPSNASGEGQAG